DVVARFGIEDAVERDRRLADLTTQLADLAAQVEAREAALSALHAEAAAVNDELVRMRDAVALQELGLFDYEHPAEASASLQTELQAVRARIKTLNKVGQAVTASSNFTFNNSSAKGRKFVNDMSKIMLRAYLSESAR